MPEQKQASTFDIRKIYLRFQLMLQLELKN